MLRTLLLALSLALVACGGGGKPADRTPDDPGGGGGGGGDDGPAESATCCCETYDLETPDIGYSMLATSDCAAASGNCEDTEELCEAD